MLIFWPLRVRNYLFFCTTKKIIKQFCSHLFFHRRNAIWVNQQRLALLGNLNRLDTDAGRLQAGLIFCFEFFSFKNFIFLSINKICFIFFHKFFSKKRKFRKIIFVIFFKKRSTKLREIFQKIIFENFLKIHEMNQFHESFQKEKSLAKIEN